MTELSRIRARMAVMFFIIGLTGGALLAAPPGRGEFQNLFKSNKVDDAKKLFSDSRKQMLEQKDYKAIETLVREWLHAVRSRFTPPHARKVAMEYIAEVCSWEEFGWTENLGLYGSVASNLWDFASPPQALEYSSKLLLQCKAGGEGAEQAVTEVLVRLRTIPNREKELAEARKSFAKACTQAFPVSGIGAEEAFTLKFYEILTAELFQSGLTDTGSEYLKQILKHWESLDAIKEVPPQSVQNLVRTIAKITLDGNDAKGAVRVLTYFTENAPDKWFWASWSKLMAGVPEGERKARYLDLLKRYGAAAVRASLGLWVENTKGTEIEKVIHEHCAPMSVEIELGVESQSFQHLLGLLQSRNAFAETQQITEFLWLNFPDSHVGRQAFGAWSERQKGIIGEGAVVETARELANCYPMSPIARRAQLELSRAQMARGHILGGLLAANPGPEGERISDQTVLTVSLLRRLAGSYVQDCKDNGIKADIADTLRKLATELDNAGEKRLACTLYWGAVQQGSSPLTDPQTSTPIDVPVGDTRAKAATDSCRAAFWRILALLATGYKTEAEKALKQALEDFPKSELIGTARLHVVNHYYDRYHKGIKSPNESPMSNLEKAWRHWDTCPEKLKDNARQWPLYQAMVNLQIQKLEQERLKDLRRKLSSGHPDPDKILMAIADILLNKKDFAKAVKNYEAVIARHPESPDRPRALYNAILIYRRKPPNTKRAADLTKMLETQYPNSRYMLMRGN